MPTYALTVAYDGTHFCGWQKQEPFAPTAGPAAGTPAGTPAGTTTARPPDQLEYHDDGNPHDEPLSREALAWQNEDLGVREGEQRPRMALRTVQHVLERAVREVVREPVRLQGASRTDAGVHARGQVAAFACSDDAWPLSRGADRLLRAVNGRLPRDVLVVGAAPVREGFDPVRDCTRKCYTYTLHQAHTRPLWGRGLAHHVYDALDVSAMRRAGELLTGEHDFASFAAAGHGRLSTVRTVFACEVEEAPASPEGTALAAPAGVLATREGACTLEAPRVVRIRVEGSGFLYNMVRIIAGTLVEVGRGRMQPDAIPAILTAKDRAHAGPTLPPTGLCLEWIRYA